MKAPSIETLISSNSAIYFHQQANSKLLQMLADNFAQLCYLAPSKYQHFENAISQSIGSDMNSRISRLEINTVTFNTSPFSITNLADESEYNQCSLSKTFSYFKLWINILQAVSNNHIPKSQLRNLARLAADKAFLGLLRSVLATDFITVKIFRDKLFEAACAEQNISLMSLLIDLGVKIDDPYIKFRLQSVLQDAVINGKEDLAEFAIRNGARYWSFDQFVLSNPDLVGNFYIDFEPDFTLVDIAIDQWNVDMLKFLLCSPILRSAGDLPHPIESLRFAAGLGQTEMVETLLANVDGLLEEALNIPWYITEAAAAAGPSLYVQERKSSPICLLQFLADQGFDIFSKDPSGYGSVLSAAALSEDIEFFKHILSIVKDCDGIAFGFRPENSSGNPDLYESSSIWTNRFKAIRGLAPLHVACFVGSLDLVEILLDAGADPNQNCSIYPIQLAAREGYYGILSKLVDAGADINAVSLGNELFRLFDYDRYDYSDQYSDLPAIILAAYGFGVDSFEFLFRKGGWTYEVDKAWKHTVLPKLIEEEFGVYDSIIGLGIMKPYWTMQNICHCIKVRGWKFAKELFEGSPDLYKMLNSNEAVDIALENGDPAIIDEFLSSGRTSFPHLNVVIQRSLLFALEKAVGIAPSNLVLIDRLLRINVDPFQSSKHNRNDPSFQMDRWFRYMYHEGHPGRRSPKAKSIEFAETFGLFDRYTRKMRAFVNLQHCSAFFLALYLRQEETLRSFLKWAHNQEKSPDQIYRLRELSAASICTRIMGEPRLEEIFTAHGFDLFFAERNLGKSCVKILLTFGLNSALREAKYDIAMKLLTMGANPDGPSLAWDWWHTPLQYAAERNHAELVTKLIEKGARADYKPMPRNGATALQFAAINGNFSILRILLKAGADINAPRCKYDGRTAIEGAAEWGRVDMVLFLLEAGADIQGRNNRSYQRTICRAWKKGHRHLVQMIQDWKKEKYGIEDCESIENILGIIGEKKLHLKNDKDLPEACSETGNKHVVLEEGSLPGEKRGENSIWELVGAGEQNVVLKGSTSDMLDIDVRGIPGGYGAEYISFLEPWVGETYS